MTALHELLDINALTEQIAAGWITDRRHPDDNDLRILNYSPAAQYAQKAGTWTRETSACRGLIVRDDEIVARPWTKFFNYGEHPEGSLDLSAPVEVTDKMDGSLGIIYPAPDGYPAKHDPDAALLFMLLDGRDLGPAIWKQLRPAGSQPMLTGGEAAA